MSNVEERVVRMRFDGSNFETGAAKALSMMEKLQSALQFKHGSDGLNSIKKASNGFNMNGVTSSIEIVTSRFSALQEFVTGVFRRLGERAFDFGLNLAKSVTVKPILDGFNEYETQMRSIQTISANTGLSGKEGIAKINSALDELNTYADKTIYNFSEMTRNIGTFTAAGVDLDTSTKAIKGIANLAAVSGASSQKASSAMYQLSQAIASGTVKLQDWNSVVTNQMGGAVFQKALIRTARAHGIAVDDMIKKNGTFRESLKEGWLTTEVLTDTLSQLTIEYDEVGDAAYNSAMQKLLDSNYSKEDAEEILELAKTAEEAATMVRTWTQLWDTVGEALGSGWAASFRIIVGDFNKATEFFTWASTKLSDIINQSSESRNKFLTDWAKAGGRQGVIDIIANSFEALRVIVSSVSDAFKSVFGVANGKSAADFILKLSELSEKLILSDGAAKYLTETFKIIFGIIKGGIGVLKSIVKYLGNLFGSIAKALRKANAFRRLVVIAERFTNSFYKIIHAIGSAFSEVFKLSDKTSGVFSGFIGRALRLLETFSKSLSVSDSFATKLHDTFKSLFESIKNGENPIKAFGDFLYNSITGAFNNLKSFNLTDWISEHFSSIDFSKIFSAVSTVVIGVTLTDIVNKIRTFVDDLKKEDDKASPFKKINDVLDGVSTAVSNFQEKLKFDKIKEIGKTLGLLAVSLLLLSLVPSDKIGTSLVALAGAIGELFLAVQLFSMFGKVKKLTISTVLLSLASSLLVISLAIKLMSTLSWEEIGKGLIGISASILVLTAALRFMPDKGRLGASSKAIKRLSKALLVLSLAMKVLGTLTWQQIAKGLVAISASMVILTVALHHLPDKGRLFSSSKAIKRMATALIVLSLAMKVLSTLTWEQIAKGLVSICVLLGALTISLNNMPDSGRLLSSSIAIVLISAGLTILSGVVSSLSKLSWEEIGKGLASVCALLAALTIALNLMPDSGRILSSAVAILVIGVSFGMLAGAVTQLAKLSWTEIAKGLLSIAGLFVVLGAALILVQHNIMGAASILIMAAGIGILADAIKQLGGLPIGALVIGILGMAGAIGAVCLVAFLAKPAIPWLFAIAASLAIIGFAAASIISSISGASQALSDLCAPAAEAGNNLVNGLTAGITGYGGKLVDSAIALAKTFLSGLMGPQALDEHSPSKATEEIGENAMEGFLNGIGNKLSEISESGSDSGGSFLDGLDTSNLAKNLGSKAQEALTSFMNGFNTDELSQKGADMIAGLVSGIGENLSEKMQTKASEVFHSFVDPICSFFGIQSPSTYMAEIGGNVVQGMINGIGDFLGGLGVKASELGTTVLNGVASLPGLVVDTAKNAAGGFVEKVGSFVGSAGTKAKALATSASEGLKKFGAGAKTAVEGGVKNFISGISGKANAAKTATTTMVNGTKGGLTPAAKQFKSQGTAAAKGFTQGISSAAGSARNAARSLANAAASGVSSSGAYNAFYRNGSYVAQGFVNGMRSQLASVRRIAAQMVSTADAATRKAGNIASPSKVFIQLGKYVGQGFAIGMEKTIPQIWDSATEMAEAAPDAFSDTLKSLSINMDDLLETDYNPVITPVIDPTQFDSDMTNLTTMLNNRMPNNFNVGAVNYSQQFASKLADYADVNKQAIEAFANNAIDYDQLGVSVANALIRSGVHVEMDGGQLMGYLAGEIRDARRMYG